MNQDKSSRKVFRCRLRLVEGVKGVTNSIQIKPSRTANEVKSKIEAAFLRNAMIDASKITVETSGGNVTLKGSVKSWSEHDPAEHVAWRASGVCMVDDRIRIGA